MRESISYIKDHLAITVESLGPSALINAAKTSMGSKIIASDSDFFADIIVKALQRVKNVDAQSGKVTVPVKSINILKAPGKSARDSALIEGYALNCTIASQGMPHSIQKAKIAFLDFNVAKPKLPLGVSIDLKDPKELEKVHQRESDLLKERLAKIVDAGANVILTTKAMDDLATKFLVEKGVMGVRRFVILPLLATDS
jgi:T-complex protein 1 subunit alpha